MEIKEGTELDWAIAEAVGITPHDAVDCTVLVTSREWDEMRGIEHPTCEGDVACIPFQPSTDLNAAFAAAEKAGMFLELQRLSTLWMASTHVLKGRFEVAPTPALAICAAILKLKNV